MTKKEDGSLPLWKSGDRGANFGPIGVFDASQKGHVLGRRGSTSLLSHAHVHENPPQPRFEACVAAKVADRPDTRLRRPRGLHRDRARPHQGWRPRSEGSARNARGRSSRCRGSSPSQLVRAAAASPLVRCAAWQVRLAVRLDRHRCAGLLSVSRDIPAHSGRREDYLPRRWLTSRRAPLRDHRRWLTRRPAPRGNRRLTQLVEGRAPARAAPHRRHLRPAGLRPLTPTRRAVLPGRRPRLGARRRRARSDRARRQRRAAAGSRSTSRSSTPTG